MKPENAIVELVCYFVWLLQYVIGLKLVPVCIKIEDYSINPYKNISFFFLRLLQEFLLDKGQTQTFAPISPMQTPKAPGVENVEKWLFQNIQILSGAYIDWSNHYCSIDRIYQKSGVSKLCFQTEPPVFE